MTDHTLIAELRDLITDWDGADIPDCSLPRIDILCGTIRRAISALENPAVALADATKDPADLSSLRKGAEVVAWRIRPIGDQVWHLTDDPRPRLGYEMQPLAALVSGSREDGA